MSICEYNFIMLICSITNKPFCGYKVYSSMSIMENNGFIWVSGMLTSSLLSSTITEKCLHDHDDGIVLTRKM